MRNFIFCDVDTGRVTSSHAVPDDFDTSVFQEPGVMHEVPSYLRDCGDYIWNGSGVVFSPPKNADSEWVRVRAWRDKQLAESDWVRLKAMDTGGVVPKSWLDYRQALRDITDQSDPFAIVWPEPPRE